MLLSLFLAKVKQEKRCFLDRLGLGMVLVRAQQSIFAFSNTNSQKIADTVGKLCKPRHIIKVLYRCV